MFNSNITFTLLCRHFVTIFLFIKLDAFSQVLACKVTEVFLIPNNLLRLVFIVQDNFAHPDVEWGPVTNDPRCGVSAIRRSVAQRRIVGGDEAGFGTFPWQAYIRIGTSRSDIFHETLQNKNL